MRQLQNALSIDELVKGQGMIVVAFFLPIISQQMSSNGFDERDVEDLLKGIPVALGGGKIKVEAPFSSRGDIFWRAISPLPGPTCYYGFVYFGKLTAMASRMFVLL